MKNLDFKKLLVLLLIIAAAVAVVFLIFKVVSKDSLNDEEKKKIEEKVSSYYTNLTDGYTTVYGGTDMLFQKESTTFADLETASVIYTAIKYAENNEIDTSVKTMYLDSIKAEGKYGDLSDYSAYSGTGVREAIKALFGEVNYTDTSSTDNHNFKYDYVYISKYDLYLMKKSNALEIENSKQHVEKHVIKTEEKEDKIVTTVAIAYVYDDGTTIKYASDKNGENIIVEDVKEFPTDFIDKFDKFEITLTKKDNNYIFESIKKVK